MKIYPGPRGVAWSPAEAEQISADRQSRSAILAVLYGQSPELAKQIMDPVFGYWEKQLCDFKARFPERGAFANPLGELAERIASNREEDHEGSVPSLGD